MPIIKSAKKRARTARIATVRNSKTKRSLKGALKTFAKSPSAKALNEAMSLIDKAAKKNVIHKHKAARLKKQVAASGKNAGIRPSSTARKAASKPATKAVPAKKSPAKTSTAKKPAVKSASKPVAKKAPAKKPTSKK